MTEWKISTPSTYLEVKEVWAIINTIPHVSKHIERDQLLLRTMWETGGRVSEVVQLQPRQILDDEFALILLNLKQEPLKKKKNPKKKKDHYKKTYISSKLLQDLNLYCQKHQVTGNNWIFKANRHAWQHLSRNYVWWIVHKAAVVAGIEKGSLTKGGKAYAWPHLFRHACAMHILDKTGKTEKAQRQLGHSSLITTQAYATLKLRQSDREVSDIFEEEYDRT